MTFPELAVPLETAEAYFAGRLYADRWESASESDRRKGLSWGAALISAGFIWNSAAYGGNTWDPAVTAAVCEEALWLLTCDPSEYPPLLTKGIRRAAAGSVSAELDPELITPLICRTAIEMVGELGTLRSGTNRITSTLL